MEEIKIKSTKGLGGVVSSFWHILVHSLLSDYSLKWRWINKLWSSFRAKILTDICLQTLSVPRSEHFSESDAQGKLWASRNEISKLAPNGGYFVYFLRTIFIFNARDFSVEFLSFSVLWHNFIQQINISLPLQQ